jgi:hypothetical protein
MKRPSLALALLLVPLAVAYQDDDVPAPIGLEPLAQEDEEEDLPTLGLTVLTPAQKLFEDLLGCWQLSTIESPHIGAAGRVMRGYLLVGDGFLSVEIHMAWDQAGRQLEDAFQSGIHEFTLDDFGTLRTSTLIGASLDDYFELEWERPGVAREYQVKLAGAFLELRRSDGAVYVFSRRPSRAGRADRDIFGNPLPGKARRDMFGRLVEEEKERVNPMDLPPKKPVPVEEPGEGDDTDGN